jgi:hypothetical protein
MINSPLSDSSEAGDIVREEMRNIEAGVLDMTKVGFEDTDMVYRQRLLNIMSMSTSHRDIIVKLFCIIDTMPAMIGLIL